MTYQLPPEHVLVLRTSNKDRISHNGFQWPESGPVEAPDWSPEPICGRGLHGALWGEGNGSLFNWVEDATWQVVEVLEKDIVDLGGKIKFPQGNVVFSGSREGATNFLLANGGQGKAVIGAWVANPSSNGHATAGDYGTATAGIGGTATAGRDGKISIDYWDGTRSRTKGGYIGEEGLLPNVPYKLDYKFNFVKA